MEDKIVVEFKSKYDWQNKRYHRIGDKEKILESSYYRVTTNKNLDNLNIDEKYELVLMSGELTNLLNYKLKNYIYES